MDFEHLKYGESRESSTRHLFYSHVKSKWLKQRSFTFVARERAVLRAGFKHLFQVRGDTKVGEGTLPWATPYLGPSRFFFKWEENKYFLPYAYCFIFKSDVLNPNFVEKKSYFILFFLESYFFNEKNIFDVRFYWNKKAKHRFVYERKLK